MTDYPEIWYSQRIVGYIFNQLTKKKSNGEKENVQF